MSALPFHSQLDSADCGPTCLKMIAEYYGKRYSVDTLRVRTHSTRRGVSLFSISNAAESIGMRALGLRATFGQLGTDVVLPCIAHWRQEHFIVIYRTRKDEVLVGDPAIGRVKYSKREFLEGWTGGDDGESAEGVLLQIVPARGFDRQDGDNLRRSSLKSFLPYLAKYKGLIIQLVAGLILASLFSLFLPYLTQSIIDHGITNRNVSFIFIVLSAQMMLFLGTTSVQSIRGWILLHVTTRTSIAYVADFLSKLMKLPIGFFDSRMVGDIMQRIGDYRRIEDFFGSSSLNVLFSSINVIVFGIVLAIYEIRLFAVFAVGSVAYILWTLLFLNKRRQLDFKRFRQMSDNQSNLIQLIQGMPDIKLNSCETQKKRQWEKIQLNLFQVNVNGLKLEQIQTIGASTINELKNIGITLLAAEAVIAGEMSLGMMLAVQFIIGQLSGPLQQMTSFLRSTQDARISLERLNELSEVKEEEAEGVPKIMVMPQETSISLKDLSFQYEGPQSEFVLQNINLVIPAKKVTAIVGESGSGKTTLIKLLLRFYENYGGEIRVGDSLLNEVSLKLWRNSCGVVLQDSFIFTDTIANNIAVGVDNIDNQRLAQAATIANVEEFVRHFPQGYATIIGQEGQGLSQGQKQRILIARAAYKNPIYLFLDEATNSLDAKTELSIMRGFDHFFAGKTVVIVAHRLSTVKNAFQIVVLQRGCIVEIGTHAELTEKRGPYYSLVKNQLELEN